ncbi:putative thiopurine S-methyltransferase [Orchesella cincta]|uniref:Putative thiopurine S-methyltransferase n=1 Tax=Orchesella cincta TaxID=48709 RepID=A0A1D2MA53_ORCCI|nr:putative thiopurine S-methyltransferase [Orchesella cincta]
MEKWETRWNENKLRWHKDAIDPLLIKHLGKLHEKDKDDPISTSPKKFFVPLCGKTLDIAYILSLGYHVFAVEGVRKAVDTLNTENNFGLEFHEQDSIFKTLDGKLQIYLGDLFTCPFEKWAPFDYVWDKGSLTAIDEESRQKYKISMQKSVQIPGSNDYHNFKYLLRTVIYDKSKSEGMGPKCVSETDMNDLYGDWTNITLLESVKLPEGHILRRNINIGSVCHENIYLLSPKSINE